MGIRNLVEAEDREVEARLVVLESLTINHRHRHPENIPYHRITGVTLHHHHHRPIQHIFILREDLS